MLSKLLTNTPTPIHLQIEQYTNTLQFNNKKPVGHAPQNIRCQDKFILAGSHFLMIDSMSEQQSEPYKYLQYSWSLKWVISGELTLKSMQYIVPTKIFKEMIEKVYL